MTEEDRRWQAPAEPPPGGLTEPPSSAGPAVPPPADNRGWAPYETQHAGQWRVTNDHGGAPPQPPTTGKRPKVEFSAKRLAVTILVVLLVAGAGAGGVAYGYSQGRDGSQEYYQPRVTDLQTQLATAQAALAKQSADAAAVPDLAAIAAKHPGMEPLNQTSTSLEVTYKNTDPDGKIVAVYAFMTQLGFTGATLDRMGKTRALDGTLTAQGHNCNVSWTYHPDDGLQMVFEAKAG